MPPGAVDLREAHAVADWSGRLRLRQPAALTAATGYFIGVDSMSSRVSRV